MSRCLVPFGLVRNCLDLWQLIDIIQLLFIINLDLEDIAFLVHPPVSDVAVEVWNLQSRFRSWKRAVAIAKPRLDSGRMP